ncbi:T6SS effector phospholipase Tle3 domain-containing protein [Rahnella selenatireducens]|uniref:T6SS effector phospholipase Tle3 domain-containing protein n=1 Tax=Rahnella selenatireducens TaxID=3389797 RepID=UPI00396972B0
MSLAPWGGGKSGTHRAEADWISHSFDVFFEGKPACRLTDKMFMNHRNTVNMAGLVQDSLPEMVIGNAAAKEREKRSVNQDDEDKLPPMPCIVILVHGVNDVGEAYQNQETGLVKGLKERLGRTDLCAHEWANYLAIPNMDAHKTSNVPGRSPIIPFYWGYKPVTHDDYVADQQHYRDEVRKLGDDAKLTYDAYQENDPNKMAAQGNDGHNSVKFQNDSFKNALDPHYAKNGGTFANATTNIPDMLGPGSNGLVVASIGFGTLYANGGDYTHPIYPNPHRIYQFFAAQRLADLILQIRNEPTTAKDVINIVAHSQGTIITMLANMLVRQAGQKPVNCTILNHSPYSLESRFSKNLQEGRHQTTDARQKTFKNFCKLMATQYKGGTHAEGEINAFEDLSVLGAADKNHWHSDPRFRRNNNGKVYNYFCPDDGTVSLQNIKGFGWRGVEKEITRDIPNLYQRVFYQHGVVGNKPEGKPFSMPAKQKGDFKTTLVKNSSYDYEDVLINGEELPKPFTFKLMGQGNQYQ